MYVFLYNACYSMPGTPALPLDLMETGQSVDSYVGLTVQQLLGDYVLYVYDLLLWLMTHLCSSNYQKDARQGVW